MSTQDFKTMILISFYPNPFSAFWLIFCFCLVESAEDSTLYTLTGGICIIWENLLVIGFWILPWWTINQWPLDYASKISCFLIIRTFFSSDKSPSMLKLSFAGKRKADTENTEFVPSPVICSPCWHDINSSYVQGLGSRSGGHCGCQ